MNEKEKAGLDRLKTKRDIQRALKETRRKKKGFRIVASGKDKISIATHILVLVGLAILKYILQIGTFIRFDFLNDFLPSQLQLSEKLVGGIMTVVFVLTITKFIKVLFINGIEDTATKYNLKRVFNLLVGIVLFFMVVSILFANWYTAVVSLGLISLILGFALQIPITSFIAWIHIILTRPFKVGDRIKIGEACGDVIDIGYLETTLWETLGESLASDHFTGRVIRFPNSNILSNPVYNYSWPLFPYIWDEAKFYIGYNSDFTFAAELIRKVTEKEMGTELSDTIHLYHELLKETPVDEKGVVEKPTVYFRTHDNMWMEATVRYLVDPKDSGTLKNKLVEKVVEEMVKYPEKIMLPMGPER